MTVWILFGVSVVLNCGALGYIVWLLRPPEEGPKISLDIHCPACGNRGCKLAFKQEQMKVYRECTTCGCQVTQPPVAPDLLEKKK